MRKDVAVLCAASGLLLVGCVGTTTTLDTQGPHPRVPEEQVHVFLATDTVPAECARHAAISAWGDALATTRKQMITTARRDAGKLGANAVQIHQVRNPSVARVLVSWFWPPLRWRKGDATAYRCPAGRLPAGPGRPAA